MNRSHAYLSPSSAHRWMNCTKSVQLCEGLPDQPSKHAQRGVYLHDVAHKLLTEQQVNPNLDIDEQQAVMSYVTYCSSLPGKTLYEEKVDFSKIVPDGFGTTDCINVDGDTLTAVDLKTGRGVKVYAQDNEQLMLYAIGALDTLYIDQVCPIKKVKLVVHQNIIDHVDEWVLSVHELDDFGFQANIKALEALDPDIASFAPSQDTCRFCKAQGICKAYQDFVFDDVVKQFVDVSAQPVVDADKLSNDDIAALLPKLDELESWSKSVRSVAKDKLNIGEEIKGFKLVQGRASRRWIDESEAIETIIDRGLLGQGEVYTKKAISPAQAQKILKKNYPLIEDLVEKSHGPSRVAPESSSIQETQTIIDQFKPVSAA